LSPSKNAGRVVCFGDLCIDIVARTPGHQAVETDTTIEQLKIRVAGAAANCGIAAATAGANVEVVGMVGADPFGAMILERLKASGVGIRFVRQSDDQTGIVISQVRPDGERSFLSYRGANAQSYGELPGTLLTDADYLYLCGYSLQGEASAATALALKAQTPACLFDPTYLFAREFQTRHKEHVAGVHILTPNLEEAQLMTGRDSAEECAAALRDFGVAIVIVKLGGRGCYVDAGSFTQLVATEPVTGKVDTTGAGDCFCGTLLAKCLEGLDILKAAESANDAARRVVCS
jgi:sugar/nucleoside kinase (ribokinase family)